MPSLLTPNSLQAVIDDLALSDDQRIKFMEFAKGAGLMDERVNFALHLMAQKAPATQIRDRLMAAYKISARHAYRIREQALNIRQNCDMEMAQKSFLMKAG